MWKKPLKQQKAFIALFFMVILSGCFIPVKTGLGRVGKYKEFFEGRRLGIIANHTACERKGRSVVEVFKDTPDAKVAALFSPEHGLWGHERAGGGIDNYVDPVYGLPVRSLYGETRKPTGEMLRDLDVLVFDIQGIGARFYTYISTMSLAMEAAAENGKRFVVLDRPNPITGVRVEGNVLDPEVASFVGLHPVPVRHGMTAGELAKMFNGEGWLAGGLKADLAVIPMEGWRRGMWYDQTGLRFIKPSPNMPCLKTAALYPGLCLLEGTNVSEGRGTDKPFRQFGAPWIDSKRLCQNLNKLDIPGIYFEPAVFMPESSKFKGQLCHGVRITITDRNALEPYFAGIRIVDQIHRLYPEEFRWRAGHFDRLCGTCEVRKAIIGGACLHKLREKWQAELKSFKRIREKYLIYPD